MASGMARMNEAGKAPTWRYIIRLWPILLIFMALQLTMRLSGNSNVLGLSRWISLFDICFLFMVLVTAGIWVQRPVALSAGRIAGGKEREMGRLVDHMAQLPWRALRGYTSAGLVFFTYLMLLLLAAAAMHRVTMTAEMILALGLSVFYGAGVLTPVLGVAVTLDYATRLRQSLARAGMFLEGLEHLQGFPALTGSVRRPWVIFIVTSLLPAACLAVYVYLAVMVHDAEQQRFIIQQAVVMLVSLLLAGTALVAVLSRTLRRVTTSLGLGLQFLRLGQFDGRVPVLMDDEMGELARGLNTALQGMQERDTMKDSLRIASEIHEGLLPRTQPSIPGYAMAALQRSCHDVGGDYYDHIVLPDGRIWLVMADVAGKGYPAALTVANLQAMLHALASLGIPIDEAARYINRTLCRTLTGGRFVTMFLALLQPEDHSLRWLNAGHVPPLMCCDGKPVRLEAASPPLGLKEDEAFDVVYRLLEPGDTLLALTDGIIEAPRPDSEMFGENRVSEWFVSHRDLAVEAMPEALMDALRDFGAKDLEDDVTMLFLRRTAGREKEGKT
jgi:phosphoserine phosphatase RsbU/P